MEKSLLVTSTLSLAACVALALVLASTFPQTNRAVPNTPAKSSKNEAAKEDSNVCLTPGCVKIAAQYLDNANLSANPCEDFYEFACGQFEKKAVIPDHETSSTAFQAAEDDLNNRLRAVLEEPSKPEDSEVFRKTRDFYSACMNKTEIARLKDEPLKDLLKKLGGWPVVVGANWTEETFVWTEMVRKLRSLGAGHNILFDFSVSTDALNSSTYSIEVDEPSLGMPGRSYLLKGIEDVLVKKYLNFMVQTAILLGADPAQAKKELTESLLFEIQLANYTLPKEDRRNFTRLYNKMTLKKLGSFAPLVNWVEYANSLLVENVTEDEVVVVVSPAYMSNVTRLIETTTKRTLANYMIWRVAMSVLGMLDDRHRANWLEYIGAITGQAVDDPRWRICLSTTRAHFGNAIGSMYVRRYFDEDARKTALTLVKTIRTEFLEILKEVDWMDDITRNRAIGKAHAMVEMIAYPLELLNDSSIEYYYRNITVQKNIYFNTTLAMKKQWSDYRYGKLRQPSIRNDWRDIGAVAVVNAYYSPSQNLIMFPAGILQGVFFANDRPKYVNYGAIGFVIGHEITHGFDDQGRQFDDIGNLKGWWESETDEKFRKKAKCIIDQYSNYTMPEVDLPINGINTQGENIADNGGVKEAYKAYGKWVEENSEEAPLPGLKFTTRQLFWMSFANVWCSKTRPEAVVLRLLTGVHSPQRFRVNGVVSNSPEFAKDFSCPVGSPMRPEHRCVVW